MKDNKNPNGEMKICSKVVPGIGSVSYKCTQKEFKTQQSTQATAAKSWVNFKETAAKIAKYTVNNIFTTPGL